MLLMLLLVVVVEEEAPKEDAAVSIALVTESYDRSMPVVLDFLPPFFDFDSIFANDCCLETSDEVEEERRRGCWVPPCCR